MYTVPTIILYVFYKSYVFTYVFHSIEKERESPRSSVYFAQMTSSQFVELAQLCPDHNEIGSHLLTLAKSLSASEPLTTQSKSLFIITYACTCHPTSTLYI